MIAIIDYKMGNLRSVENALQRLGADFQVTSDATVIRRADRVLLPGVGNCGKAMENLKESNLIPVIKDLRRPVLGINVACIGLFDAHVQQFEATAEVKVPHVGWNQLGNLEKTLFKDIDSGSFVYYVHSYYANLCPDTIATTKHGLLFSAALKYENFYGTQFHPEKSGDEGERILKNFLERC